MERAPGIRPSLNLWQRIDAVGRAGFPVASTVLLLFALSVPLGVPGQSALRPALTLACVFFWSLHRPAAMRPAAAFVLGVLADLLGAAPIGIGTIALLVCQAIALRWRRVLIRQDGVTLWVAFVGVSLLFSAMVWSLNSVLAWTLLPLEPVLFQAALAAGSYPVLSLALARAHRGIADPEGV